MILVTLPRRLGPTTRPLFGTRDGGIHEGLFQVELALCVQVRRKQLQRLLQLAAAHPLLKAAMAGLERQILLQQLSPLRTGS